MYTRIEILIVAIYALKLTTVDGQFELSLGEAYCEITNGGKCFQTINYPIQYKAEESCTIKTKHALKLQVVGFDVEEDDDTCSGSYDFLSARGLQYCGTVGPNNISVLGGDLLTWKTDADYYANGFKICSTDISPVCSHTTGLVKNVGDCWCGESVISIECSSSKGLYCNSKAKKCSTTPIEVCSVQNGTLPNKQSCTCGDIECDSTLGLFCKSDKSQCSKFTPCVYDIGLRENEEICSCANSKCDLTTGLFCVNDNNIGACAKQMFTFVPLSDATIHEAVKNWISSDLTKRALVIKKFGAMREWNTSNVTSFRRLFRGLSFFTADLSKWDVRKVTTMESTFESAVVFNSDISKWKTERLTNMEEMFQRAELFTSDLSKFSTGKVTNMFDLFRGAVSFNSDLATWDTRNCTDMQGMFDGAKSFNSDLANWQIGKVVYCNAMFYEASSFNSDLSKWDTGNVEQFPTMFQGAVVFNSVVSSWDLSSVETLYNALEDMFKDAKKFNQVWCSQNWQDSSIQGAGTPGDDFKGTDNAGSLCCEPGKFYSGLHGATRQSCEKCPTG